MIYIRVSDNSAWYRPKGRGENKTTVAMMMVRKGCWAIDLVENASRDSSYSWINKGNTRRFHALNRLIPESEDVEAVRLVLCDKDNHKCWYIGKIIPNAEGNNRCFADSTRSYFNDPEVKTMRSGHPYMEHEMVIKVEGTPMGNANEDDWNWMKSGGEIYPTLKKLTELYL